jgi:uncharacterized protein (TIGR03437 family)
MRLANLAVVLFSIVVCTPRASAVLTLGTSNQTFGLTGIGPNSSGQGQSKITWGNCAYDGTNTTCTLSAPFTGLGAGGTMSFAVIYPGNGAFPLIAVTNPGSDSFFLQALSNYSILVTISPTNGTAFHLYQFPNFSIVYSNPTCTGLPAGMCGVGLTGQTAGATMTGLFTGSLDPAPNIKPGGVISASNYGAFSSIAPATWIEIYGTNLATIQTQTWAGSDFVNNVAPTALGGTTVTVGGQPAYVYFVTPGQLNVQVPSGIGTGPMPVVVTTAGGSSTAYSIQVNSVEPGLLAPPAFNLSGNQNVVALINNTLTYDLPVKVAGVLTALAKPGDTLTLYGIGFGTVTPSILAGQVVNQLNALTSALTITIGGAPATITYQGLAPGYVGLYQFNVTVPNIPANNNAPVALMVNGSPVPQKLVVAIGN